MTLDDDLLVTVCAECLRASCWQAVFQCEAWRTASTKQMRVAELRALALESSHHWAPVDGARTGDGS